MPPPTVPVCHALQPQHATPSWTGQALGGWHNTAAAPQPLTQLDPTVGKRARVGSRGCEGTEQHTRRQELSMWGTWVVAP